MNIDVTKMSDEDIEHIARLATDNPGDKRVWTHGEIYMTFSGKKVMRSWVGFAPKEIYILDDRQRFKISVTTNGSVQISNCKKHAVCNRQKIRRYLLSLNLPVIEPAGASNGNIRDSPHVGTS